VKSEESGIIGLFLILNRIQRQSGGARW